MPTPSCDLASSTYRAWKSSEPWLRPPTKIRLPPASENILETDIAMSSVAARLAAEDPCGYFRNAGIATFVRHLGETRCHRCLALFAELRRASLLQDTTSKEPPTQAASPSEALSHHSVPSERSVDHWLAHGYSL